MDFVEGLVELGSWVSGPRAWAEAWAARKAGLFEATEAIVHVDTHVFGLLNAFLIRDFHRPIHGMKHPEFGDGYHNGKADGPRVLLGVMVAVEGEIRRGEA